MHALQIEAAAEGRAEGGECQEPDGQRMAVICRISCREPACPRDPDSEQHRLVRLAAATAARERSASTATSRRKSAPPEALPTKQQTAGGADDERPPALPDLGRSVWLTPTSGIRSRRLKWQIWHGDKCATRCCIARLSEAAGAPSPFPEREGGGIARICSPVPFSSPGSRAEVRAATAIAGPP